MDAKYYQKDYSAQDAEVHTEYLDYNTQRPKLLMREYGRNVVSMVEQLKSIPDKAKRTEQAAAVIRSMKALNPSVVSEENWEHKLWDHLFIIAGYDLDIDSPYPKPEPEDAQTRPMPIPLRETPVKATHYGRNIENIIEVICEVEDGEAKTEMIRRLAVYMRQQYLIWNKDSVADQTILHDIEKLSDYRIHIPEGMTLSKVSSDMSYSRPGLNLDFVNRKPSGGKKFKKKR